MIKIIVLLICFPVAFVFPQTSNLNIVDSGVELTDGSKLCVDEITVQVGSSFLAYDFGQVKESNCTTNLAPSGSGTITLPVEIFDIESLPKEFTLNSAYPNPFNPSTTIHYGIPDTREVTISIYDLMGRKIAILFKNEQQAGWYKITWNGLLNNGSLAPAGMYLYKISAADEIKTSKISLIK